MSSSMDTGSVFAPLRLAHANMFVSDLERSVAFYSQIVGVELVRREPSIWMAFHSNGNSHHDIGLVQVKHGERLGIDGFQQVSSNRATRPGLNHLGWETQSEVELIKCIHRAEDRGQKIINFANHQIAHSAYIVDLEGFYHEYYADTVVRWRDIFNLDHEDLVTNAWDWQGSKPGLGPMPKDANDRRRVEGAIFHPRCITHATLATARFEETADFFTRVGGLSLVAQDGGVALFRGTGSCFDLMLVSADLGFKVGLQAIAFQVEQEDDFVASRTAAIKAGVPIVAAHDLPHKRSAVVADPDGVMVELYFRHQNAPPVLPRPQGRAVEWMFAA